MYSLYQYFIMQTTEQMDEEYFVADTDDDYDVDADLESLNTNLHTLTQKANLLGHRLDSMQSLLDRQTFQLDSHPIRVAPVAKAEQVHKLLAELGLTEEGLTLGKFLKSLNLYLLQNDLVDLNDLQIVLSPLIAAAFHKPKGLKKAPYGLLLATLPRMFVSA